MWNAMLDAASLTNVLDLLLNVLLIAMLVALSRDPGDGPSEEVPVGRLLRVASEITAMASGLVLVFAVIGLLLVPYSYSLARQSLDENLQSVHLHPHLKDMLFSHLRTEILFSHIRTVALQFCAFVVPLIVYRSSRTEKQAEEVVYGRAHR